MDRSVRATEVGLQRAKSLGAVIREKDEELALFFEMRKREKERSDNLLVDTPEELDPPPGAKPGSSPIFKIVPIEAAMRKEGPTDFLNTDSDKNDYDWLLTPPGTPLFPSLERESNPTVITPKARPTLLISRLSNPPDAQPKGNPLSRQVLSGQNASATGIRRPLSSGSTASVSSKLPGGPNAVSSKSSGSSVSVSTKASSRSATPTSRQTMPVTSKSLRPSTPTTRATLTGKATGPPRSATPSRSATPTSRPASAPPVKPSSRGPTPPRRSSAPIIASATAPSGQSLTTKSNTIMSKPSALAHNSSVKSAPSKPSALHSLSNGTILNSTSTSLPGRPTSASRGRSGPLSSRSLSAEPAPGNKIRRQSCSPSRGRAPNGMIQSGISVPAIVRSVASSNDDVNPVLMGTKMVERVINARRLAPPKLDSLRSSYGNASGKMASSDSSGFGRTLSKKSLDMAMRHMDIRQYSK